MFTGIVEEVGTILEVIKGQHSSILKIKGNIVLEDTKIGDSIAVNGICLTVTEISGSYFKCDVVHETINRTGLKDLKSNSKVNLERALRLDKRLGGHIVSGHVDGKGTIIKIEKDDNAIWFYIEASKELLKYVVEKGSITIDGISLTVATVTDSTFGISAIPHTVKSTILSEKKVGDNVNLEADILGKYVEKLLNFNRVNDLGKNNSSKTNDGITLDFMTKCGF